MSSTESCTSDSTSSSSIDFSRASTATSSALSSSSDSSSHSTYSSSSSSSALPSSSSRRSSSYSFSFKPAASDPPCLDTHSRPPTPVGEGVCDAPADSGRPPVKPHLPPVRRLNAPDAAALLAFLLVSCFRNPATPSDENDGPTTALTARVPLSDRGSSSYVHLDRCEALIAVCLSCVWAGLFSFPSPPYKSSDDPEGAADVLELKAVVPGHVYLILQKIVPPRCRRAFTDASNKGDAGWTVVLRCAAASPVGVAFLCSRSLLGGSQRGVVSGPSPETYSGSDQEEGQVDGSDSTEAPPQGKECDQPEGLVGSYLSTPPPREAWLSCDRLRQLLSLPATRVLGVVLRKLSVACAAPAAAVTATPAASLERVSSDATEANVRYEAHKLWLRGVKQRAFAAQKSAAVEASEGQVVDAARKAKAEAAYSKWKSSLLEKEKAMQEARAAAASAEKDRKVAAAVDNARRVAKWASQRHVQDPLGCNPHLDPATGEDLKALCGAEGQHPGVIIPREGASLTMVQSAHWKDTRPHRRAAFDSRVCATRDLSALSDWTL